jgi:hypothetical protein
MTIPEKYDKQVTGILSGLLLPLFVALIVFLFSKGTPGLHSWLRRIVEADIITHIITLCVFPNVLLFMLFNYFDMLRASKGILGITIVWAAIVFVVKFLL